MAFTRKLLLFLTFFIQVKGIQPCIFSNLGTIHSIQKNQNPTNSKPCNTYTFPNNLSYATCNDLPVLESSLHWNYYPKTNKVDIAFKKNNAKDSSWIAWAINPTSKGMIGSQALIGYRRSDGGFKAYTSSITSYSTMLQEGNLSFPVYDVSGMYVNGSMMIFARLELPRNLSLVNHVWQEGLVSDDGSLIAHAMTGPNVQSFGILDFKSAIVSKNIGGKLKSRTMLRNVHGIFNAVGWGTLMPIGVIFARYLKSFDGSIGPIWFHLHRACQSLALLIGTIGFGTGLYMGKQPGQHDTPHRCVGITLMTLALAQVCVAFCLRPKKDHKYRIWWNIFHIIVGYSTIILAIWNVFKGFDILVYRLKGIDVMWKYIYACVIGFLGLSAFVLEVVTWIRLLIKKKKKTTQELDV
ncbi:unnamed protein product [Trifolium pratense]|uniref:Uncharacterized protein n=1 Tax=Trifolium pratense TaxID=57577 RepID=A0ACB0J4W5_TRIPR|nr:unnamed protein product [Trifolium pratense]